MQYDSTRPDLIITSGKLVNVLSGEVYPAEVAIRGSRVVFVNEMPTNAGKGSRVLDAENSYLVPGLIDGHIHVECSKLSMTMFAEAVVPYGTTSVVSGLDQIFGVAGLRGVKEFLDESKRTPLKVFLGAPFKMPYTIPPSTIGHNFTPREHKLVQRWPECVGVWETVREFVLAHDRQVLRAMELARKNRLAVFGCAPMARGASLAEYVAAGVRADHECYSAPETLEKLRNGMSVMIRESSVAHFLKENIQVITRDNIDPRRIGFCTDDVTAKDVLEKGHLDNLVRMAIQEGVDPIKAIQMATINCAEIYRIDHLVGSISPGRIADILLVDNPETFNVRKVIANGKLVASNHQMLARLQPPPRSRNLTRTFSVRRVKAGELTVRTRLRSRRVRALSMKMSDEVPFVRKRREVFLNVRGKIVQPDTELDVLYVAVVERYGKTNHRAVAFISGLQLREGAMASSASPDDNNILCIGTNPDDMAVAVNEIVKNQGGQVVVRNGRALEFLSLPIGGIVADLEPHEMAKKEAALDGEARSLGCKLPSPFMYMIFLSITAIPDYAITDRGLIDCVGQKVISPVLGPA